ncbi:hypothetical protein E2562_037857 [Oryza meyeriana var. granulata]|uniref:Uncharacterized protein n=1 Tax=Oryza meyeriana var. granulata TaxID=110450 RepID=A0A6G1E8I2_9ORYZ|nr:hypothetical protein E2562_037857 [Oryza meyeriana var. granulata]
MNVLVTGYQLGKQQQSTTQLASQFRSVGIGKTNRRGTVGQTRLFWWVMRSKTRGKPIDDLNKTIIL